MCLSQQRTLVWLRDVWMECEIYGQSYLRSANVYALWRDLEIFEMNTTPKRAEIDVHWRDCEIGKQL